MEALEQQLPGFFGFRSPQGFELLGSRAELGGLWASVGFCCEFHVKFGVLSKLDIEIYRFIYNINYILLLSGRRLDRACCSAPGCLPPKSESKTLLGK